MATSPGRGNGHHAASYAPLADLDPHLADAVLELLADEGIAAYASPATRTNPAGEFVVPRMDRVLDRVFVDTAERGRAKAVLDSHLPGLRAAEEPAPATAEDEVWAGIVAAFDAPPPADAVPRWPASEDLTPATEDGAAGTDDSDPTPGDPRAGRGRTLRPARPLADGWAPYVDPPDGPGKSADQASRSSDDEHHFVPPVPPPLPTGDVVTRWAWVGLVGGPLLLVLAAILRVQLGPWLLLLGVAGFVGGFVTLVARMEDRPPTDSDPDDGAVV